MNTKPITVANTRSGNYWHGTRNGETTLCGRPVSAKLGLLGTIVETQRELPDGTWTAGTPIELSISCHTCSRSAR